MRSQRQLMEKKWQFRSSILKSVRWDFSYREWLLIYVYDPKVLPGTEILGQYLHLDLGWRPLMAVPMAWHSGSTCMCCFQQREPLRRKEKWSDCVHCTHHCFFANWSFVLKFMALYSQNWWIWIWICFAHLDISTCHLELSTRSLIEPSLVIW